MCYERIFFCDRFVEYRVLQFNVCGLNDHEVGSEAGDHEINPNATWLYSV